MLPYILVIMINFQIATVEFPNAGACFEVQKDISLKLKTIKNSGAACFSKLGGFEKST